MLFVKYASTVEDSRIFFENQPFSHALFSDAPDAIFILNGKDYSIIDCNSKALIFFEAENKSSLINLSSFRLYESEPIEFSKNLSEANIKNGGEHTQELRFRTLKQNVFWGKLIKRSVKIDDSEYIILRICKAVDYLNSEEALSEMLRGTAKVTGNKYFKELTRLLCRTFDVKHSVIGKFTENGKYFKIIDSYGPFHGLNPDKNPVKRCITENILKGYTTFYPADSKDLFPSDDFVTKNSIEGFMGTPVFGSSGEVVGFISFMNNKPIQEIPNSRYMLSIFASRTAAEFQRIRSKEILKEQARELADANIAKDRLLSVISHDLLNPLHSAMGFSELLHEKVEIYNKEKILERVEIIDNSIKNIYSKLVNVSDWSTVFKNSPDINPEYISLNGIVQQNLSLFEYIIKTKELSLNVNLSDCPVIHTDRHMISSIIRNLLSNAVKYTSKGGKITISYKEQTGKVKFIIQDNGIGMSKEDVDSLSRLDENLLDSQTENNRQTGIGFVIVRAFTKYLGGTFTMNSVPEKGTRITVLLPQSI